MEKVTAIETKQALISCPASTEKVPQPPTPCTITSTGSPVPLNLCVVKQPPPSTSQCHLTTTRVPVPLTPSANAPVSATLQPSAASGNPSQAIQTSSTSIQSDSHESQQEMNHKITLLLDLTKLLSNCTSETNQLSIENYSGHSHRRGTTCQQKKLEKVSKHVNNLQKSKGQTPCNWGGEECLGVLYTNG
ncbi:uncharacterized protein LOC131538617 isoform X2 [Onychostoma macrolepis]|uniref:Uncharacterized protein n=1 Tax=Onychostoma macrolepis TaxID=369639 RepID=A0A7J6D4I7_9TELE|nr:uncharacterized protein LOC131538617 isoform X2 [Onychostoma macrolepis]KAF4114150.1 hypothetical protein G5714_004373 [Onychostoma macrolepis]